MMSSSNLVSILIFSIFVKGTLSQCSFRNGPFSASWVLDRSNQVRFQVTKVGMPDNSWTAIAFGHSMNSGLDIAMVKVINGRVIVTDESVHQYGPSMLDRSQDIQVHGGSYSNGVLRVSFSRPVFAVEGRADHPINGCTPWQFVTIGGMAHGFGVGKHFRDPIMQMVCINQCRI